MRAPELLKCWREAERQTAEDGMQGGCVIIDKYLIYSLFLTIWIYCGCKQ